MKRKRRTSGFIKVFYEFRNMKMDGKDREIITLLRENARMGNSEIARKVGLSEGAVRQRVKGMVQGGRIRRFTIEEGEGGANSAIILVKASGDTKKLMSAIKMAQIASRAFEISGVYDACLILGGESVTEIDEKIDKVRGLPGVSETQTFIVLRKW